MSDTTFTSPAALELLEKAGKLTWQQGRETYRLVRSPNRKGWDREVWNHIAEEWQFDGPRTDHEAACLIRNHLRVWLEERGYEVTATFFLAGKNGIKKYEAAGQDGEVDCGASDDRDDALLAATAAAMRDKA